MLGIGGLPAVIMMFGMLFMPESPRYLVQIGNFNYFLYYLALYDCLLLNF